MKRLFLVLSAFALVLVSCSKSEDAPFIVDPVPVAASNILVSKIVTTGGETNTATYLYSGNKLISETNSSGEKSIYTYTGNFITKIEEFDGTLLLYFETLSYNSDGKLASYIKVDNNAVATQITGNKTIYTYDSAGNILFTNFSGNATVQTNQVSTGKAFVTAGEIIKIEEYVPANPLFASYTATDLITYDNKKNPGVNIQGFNKLTLQGKDIGLGGSVHNILSVTGKKGAATTSTDNSTFTYTINDFPKIETNTTGTLFVNGVPTNTGSFNIEYFY